MATTAKKPRKQESRSILINFVLDKSGSMVGLRDATISGFNEFKNDQAAEDGEAHFTLTLFDTQFRAVCEAVPVREVPDLDYATYAPDGMTALYDAIGHTMRVTDDFVAANKPDQVLFVIMTDGEENSSREFDRDRIFAMIQDRQDNAHYEFIYLGANQDSYLTGQGMGLRDGRMLDYAATDVGSRDVMRRASRNVRAHRRMGDAQRDAFFSADMEALGAIDAATWKSMDDDERQRYLDGGGPEKGT
jgi:hypothetical protein